MKVYVRMQVGLHVLGRLRATGVSLSGLAINPQHAMAAMCLLFETVKQFYTILYINNHK